MDLARQDQPWGQAFSMSVLAFRVSGQQQRGERAAPAMCHARCGAFCGRMRPEEDIPIHTVTNGIHTLTWLGNRLKRAVR